MTNNWLDSTGGLCAAFDFTTKGSFQIRHEIPLQEQIVFCNSSDY